MARARLPYRDGPAGHRLDGMGSSQLYRLTFSSTAAANAGASRRSHSADRYTSMARCHRARARRTLPAASERDPRRRGDDRDAGGERLEHDVWHAFAVRREQQQRGVTEERRDVIAGAQTVQPRRRREVASVNDAPVESIARQDDVGLGGVLQQLAHDIEQARNVFRPRVSGRRRGQPSGSSGG